jgi:hypothetical protein
VALVRRVKVTTVARVELNFREVLAVVAVALGLLGATQPPQTAATAVTACLLLLRERLSQERVAGAVVLKTKTAQRKLPVLEAVVAEALGVMEHQTVAAQTQLRAQQTRAVAVVAVDIQEQVLLAVQA